MLHATQPTGLRELGGLQAPLLFRAEVHSAIGAKSNCGSMKVVANDSPQGFFMLTIPRGARGPAASPYLGIS